MSLVDAQARRMVPAVLAHTLTVVLEDGIDTVERYKDAIAFLLANQAHDDEVTGQRVYALTYVLISEDAEGIRRVGNAIGQSIQTEL